MTSNEDWVVPAGKDERRFCALHVDPRCAQSHESFRETDEEFAKGGLEALLHDLLAFDLDSFIRQIPRTEALLEQKLRSLDSVEIYWFERLLPARRRAAARYASMRSRRRRSSTTMSRLPSAPLEYRPHAAGGEC
jgi:hypothetical protein